MQRRERRLATWTKYWGLTLKDSVSMVVSVIALSVSMLALYLNYRNVEDFSFSIGTSIPVQNPDYDNREVIVYGPKSLTFINAGNGPVAIMNVYLSILQSKQIEPVEKDCHGSKEIHIAIESFVVKPSEITIKDFAIGTELKVNERGNPLVPMEEGMRRILWCLAFDLITTKLVPERIYVPIMSSEFETPIFGTSDTFFEPSKPLKLLPR